MTTPHTASPYERVLGDALEVLHPTLSRYFAAIPRDSVGRGHGVFEVVGSPRRWLWPVLWVLGRQSVLFPVDERDVAFTVTNTPVTDAAGTPAIVAARTFRFPSGERVMVDRIGVVEAVSHAVLVDDLGTAGRYRAYLAANVVNGELHLSSTRTSIRLGRIELVVPRFIAPAVSLVERYDDDRDRQQVTVVLASPLLGKLYSYSGWFSYEVTARKGAPS